MADLAPRPSTSIAPVKRWKMAQLSILDTFKRGESVEVLYARQGPAAHLAAGRVAPKWTHATVSRVNRARAVVIVSIYGLAGTRSFPADRVRRPAAAELAPPLTPAGKPSRVRNAVVARLATAATPPEAMTSAAHDATAFGRIVTRGRSKVQTMTDLGTRERVKRAADAGNLSEGEVVRRALAIGLHAMGW